MDRFRFVIAVVLLVAWSSAVAIEEPRYTTVRAYDGFEVRSYEPYLVAETSVRAATEDAGNQGFGVLANYIFGGNKGARTIEMTAPVAQAPVRIAMTAPVTQSPIAGTYVIQFAMPPKWTLETLPQPDDARITLRAIPARTLAVLAYSGTWSQSRYQENLRKLQDALEKAGLPWHGEPVWARFDPPWKPWFLRRNEIWLAID